MQILTLGSGDEFDSRRATLWNGRWSSLFRHFQVSRVENFVLETDVFVRVVFVDQRHVLTHSSAHTLTFSRLFCVRAINTIILISEQLNLLFAVNFAFCVIELFELVEMLKVRRFELVISVSFALEAEKRRRRGANRRTSRRAEHLFIIKSI